MSSIKQLEAITQGVVQGASTADLLPQAKALFGQLPSEGLIAVFNILPRSLTYPSIDSFFAAEQKQSGSPSSVSAAAAGAAPSPAEVSSALVASAFAGCEPRSDAKFWNTVSTAVTRTENDARLTAELHKWRLALCEAKHKDAEVHATKAATYVLSAQGYVNVEPLADAVKDVKFTTQPDGKVLVELINAMLDGRGLAALPTALPTLTKLNILDSATRKVRLVALSSYCMDKRQVSFDELKAHLGTKEDDLVENLAVDAAVAGIMDAKVNKSDRTVVVRCVVPLRFGKDAWVQVRTQAVELNTFLLGLSKQYRTVTQKA